MTVTVTFNIADSNSNVLGCDAVIDDFTDEDFAAGSLTNTETSIDTLVLSASPPEDITATMTDWDEPTPNAVFSSGDYSIVSYAKWMAFDKNAGTMWRSSGALPVFILYNFNYENREGYDPEMSLVAAGYSITASTSASAPTAWTLYDPSDWTVLDSQSGLTWEDGETKTFQIASPKDCAEFRLNISATGGDSTVRIPEMQIHDSLVGEYETSGTIVSSPVSVSSYGATGPDLKIKWRENLPAGTSITVETGTSDSDSVDPATWYEQANNSSITDLPADLTGKYLYYRATLATSDTSVTPVLDWVVVYDDADSPYAAARVDFNDEIKSVPSTGSVDFTGVPESSTLDYTVHVFTLSSLVLEVEESSSVTTVASPVTENVEVPDMVLAMDGTLPAVVGGDSYGRFGHIDATLPDLECEATMGSDRSIRSGDYFNDYTLNLPVPELEASFGHRASMDVKLPALEGEARTGSIASGKLPYLEATATGSAGHVGSLDKKLPTMSLTATMGARLDKKLPAVTLEAEMSTPVLMRLNKKLPAVQGDAEITGATATLDKIICFPKITATAGQDNTATLNANLPAIQCTATVKSGQTMTLDATLPELRAEANSYSAVINLDAYLPTVTSGVASGSDYGGTGSTISGDRFDDTLLRFERWA